VLVVHPAASAGLTEDDCAEWLPAASIASTVYTCIEFAVTGSV